MDRTQERRRLVTMPEDFTITSVMVPGTHYAFRWQGVLPIHDENNFRRQDGPFLPKDLHVFRIMVVGDSLTWRDGIAGSTFSPGIWYLHRTTGEYRPKRLVARHEGSVMPEMRARPRRVSYFNGRAVLAR